MRCGGGGGVLCAYGLRASQVPKPAIQFVLHSFCCRYCVCDSGYDAWHIGVACIAAGDVYSSHIFEKNEADWKTSLRYGGSACAPVKPAQARTLATCANVSSTPSGQARRRAACSVSAVSAPASYGTPSSRLIIHSACLPSSQRGHIRLIPGCSISPICKTCVPRLARW